MSPVMMSHDLRELATWPVDEGPFASVYTETEGAVPNASQLAQRRWQPLRESLLDAGASEAVVSAVDGVVPDAHLSGAGLGVVANRERLLSVDHLPELRHPSFDRWEPLPSIVPLLRWRQDLPTHLLVLTDRLGADVFCFGWGSQPAEAETSGEDWPVHKAGAGGWSQRRYQTRVENAWKQNAKQAADQVADICKRTQPAFVAIGGDVRATALLSEVLPGTIRPLLRPVSGSRAPDGSVDTVLEEVATLVTVTVNEQTTAALDRLEADRHRPQRAAVGPAETLAALAASRVETLLVQDEPGDQRQAWFGERPDMAGVDQASVRETGAGSPRPGRLGDVAIRAALGTGATVRIVPADRGTVDDGISGLLRWQE